jgi:NADP-dependent 3-hydroxy acid dehydrogenase YdfG
MRAQRSGVITMISSVAAWEQYPNVVYKATIKSGHDCKRRSKNPSLKRPNGSVAPE